MLSADFPVFNMASTDSLSPSDFSRFVGPEHTKSTHCFHLNCQSIRNKHDMLDLFFSSLSFQFDFIMLSETWYDQHSIVWQPPGYQCFIRNRETSRGGGVSLLVRDNINIEPINEFCCTTHDFEVLSVLCARTIYSVFYRPPSGNLDLFFSVSRTVL